MDFESILVQGVIFAADVFFLTTFYKLYRKQINCLKHLQEAKCLEINSELPKTVKDAGGVIPYTVVTGEVKALTKPLSSLHIGSLQGVIYERITTEKKLRWSPLFQIWNTTTEDVKRHFLNIPFGLYGGGFFKKQTIEVLDPLSAEELILTKVYDDYQEHQNNFTNTLVDYFRGEHHIATLDVEKMLLEYTPLTAVGKLVIEDNKLKIMPPDEGLTYFLTPLSINSLTDKIKLNAQCYKVLSILLGTGALILISYYSRKGYDAIKRRIYQARQRQIDQEASIRRRLADPTRRHPSQENAPKCVVCLENPVEMLILECGHICLCLECSRQNFSLCPVCRAKVNRLVLAYLPE